jgi:hypothetical protein
MRTQLFSSRPALVACFYGLLALTMTNAPALAQTDLGAPAVTVAETAFKAVKLVELIGNKYKMGQTTEALEAPVDGAAAVVRVRQGAEVEVVGITEGDRWYQIELPDHRLAYVPLASIPAAGTPVAPASSTPASAVAPQVQAAAEDGATIDLPPTTEFEEASDQLSVVNPTAAYLAPNKHAPQAYPVRVGTMVDVIAKSTDGGWAWVNTADGTPAYIPMADMGSPPAAAP